ncbi:MAG: Omp28-related outer membrane protein [Bacteroidia bacterium]
MKYNLLTALFFSFLLFFYSCDKIEGNKLEPVVVDIDTTEKPIVNRDSGFSTIKKVLVEDYTGHTCGNCPEAAIILHGLLESPIKNNIVPMAIHAGSFALPQNPDFTMDFRTPVGNELDAKFGISAVGNPNGMIDRFGYPNTQHIIYHSDWQSKVESRVSIPPPLFISIKNSFFSVSNKIKCQIKTNIVNTLSGEYKLSVFLIEDSIIADQKDYSLPSPSHVVNYNHMHVLRASFNGTYGDVIASNPNGTASNPVQFKKEHILNYNQAWNKNHLYVVAFVYNSQTYEVIQAEYRKIKT